MYESSAGAADEFLDSLDQFIKRTDLEIERLCNKNYQGFIESVEQLLRVRRNAESLQSLIGEANEPIYDSGEVLLKTLGDLTYHRQIQRNILAAIEALTNCLPVIKLFSKATQQLSARRFYPALRTLQELEKVHLPAVAQFPFAAKISQRLPIMRLKVKDSSFVEMQDFLADIRDHSREIGEAAMLQTVQGQSLASDSSVMASASSEQVDDLCASDQADFSPLYRCLHIYDVLVGFLPQSCWCEE